LRDQISENTCEADRYALDPDHADVDGRPPWPALRC
jgi:hypothetical protein